MNIKVLCKLFFTKSQVISETFKYRAVLVEKSYLSEQPLNSQEKVYCKTIFLLQNAKSREMGEKNLTAELKISMFYLFKKKLFLNCRSSAFLKISEELMNNIENLKDFKISALVLEIACPKIVVTYRHFLKIVKNQLSNFFMDPSFFL